MPPLQRRGSSGLRKAALDAATTEEGEIGLRKAALDAATTEEGEIDYL